jgi:uncharacterized membrane protein
MELLIVGCLAFLVIHLGISGTPLRAVLQNSLGESPYLGVYSLLSFGSLGLMIYGYSQVPHTDFLWYPSVTAYKVAKVLMLLALVTIVMGTLVKNPTAVMSEQALDNEVSGMLKITRHPVQWGILLFACAHLLANGDTASILFFGTFALLSFFGMLSMDQRRRRETDPKWQAFMEKTSMVPFAALASGRLRFTLGDINWMGLIAGFALYAAIYWLHDMVSGGVSLF